MSHKSSITKEKTTNCGLMVVHRSTLGGGLTVVLGLTVGRKKFGRRQQGQSFFRP